MDRFAKRTAKMGQALTGVNGETIVSPTAFVCSENGPDEGQGRCSRNRYGRPYRARHGCGLPN